MRRRPSAISHPGAQGGGDRGTITFIVPTRAAQLITSVPSSSIYLSLVSPDYKPTAQTPLSASDPVPAEDPSQLTPYGPKGAASSN